MKLSQGFLMYYVVLILILLIPLTKNVCAQDDLIYGYSETSSAVLTTSTTFSTAVSTTISLVNANAVMVIANFELSSVNDAGTRYATLRFTDGSTYSNEIERTMNRGDGSDYGLGTLVHIFEYTNTTESVTYTLQHSSSSIKGITTQATITAIAINTSTIPLDWDLKTITSSVSATSSLAVVTGMETNAITLDQPGSIYIASSLNTNKGSTGLDTDAGEWVLRYKKGVDGTWTEMGSSITRTISNNRDTGAGSLVWLLPNQEPGDYYFQLAHRIISGGTSITTFNASLGAVGLSHSGGYFPGFSQTENSVSTSDNLSVVTSRTGTSLSSGTDLFLHSQFVVQATAAINSPEYSFSVNGSTYSWESLTLKRNISASTDLGSGALVGLAPNITQNEVYTAALNHGTPVSTETLTTSNIVLVGFRLTDFPLPNTWEGTTDTDWHDATNWTGDIPLFSEDVYIPSTGSNFPVITSSADCRNLHIGETASLTLSSSLSSVASLIVRGVTCGNATYESYIAAKQWHILSSPVEGQSIDGFIANTSNSIPTLSTVYAITDYDEGIGSWNSFFSATGNGDFENGKGYLLGRSPDDGTVSFTGSVIVDTVFAPVTNTDRGWNAIGNPFTSAIGANDLASSTVDFLELNSTLLDPSHTALYLWDEVANYDGSQNSYRVIGNFGYTDPEGLDPVGNNYVQAGQGFLINAASSGDIRFTKSMQYHDATGLLKSTNTSWDGFKLIAQKDKDKRSCIVSFNWNMTLGLDPSYDAGMLKDAGSFAVYTRLVEEDNDIDFEIQSLPDRTYEDIIVPVGLDIQEDGYVKFSLAGIILDDDKSVIFEDRELNKFVTLNSEEDFYETNIASGTSGIGRFYLHLSLAEPNSIFQAEEKDDKYNAYWNGSQIVLQGKPEISTRAILIDLNGRLLADYSLNYLSENYLSIPNKKNGIYFLRIVEGNNVTSLKIPVF